jgi:hypothetical protein
MRYEKPSVVEVAPALGAVQSSMIKHAPPQDFDLYTTAPAYQSDEE